MELQALTGKINRTWRWSWTRRGGTGRTQVSGMTRGRQAVPVTQGLQEGTGLRGWAAAEHHHPHFELKKPRCCQKRGPAVAGSRRPGCAMSLGPPGRQRPLPAGQLGASLAGGLGAVASGYSGKKTSHLIWKTEPARRKPRDCFLRTQKYPGSRRHPRSGSARQLH